MTLIDKVDDNTGSSIDFSDDVSEETENDSGNLDDNADKFDNFTKSIDSS